MDKKQELKERGLRAAAGFVENRGMDVLETGWSCSYGTFDIVAMDGEDELVFFTVKSRKASAQGIPDDVVSEAAEKRFNKMAKLYVKDSALKFETARMDMVMIFAFSESQALLRYIRGAVELDVDPKSGLYLEKKPDPEFKIEEDEPGYYQDCEDCDSRIAFTDENGTTYDCADRAHLN